MLLEATACLCAFENDFLFSACERDREVAIKMGTDALLELANAGVVSEEVCVCVHALVYFFSMFHILLFGI